MSSIMKYILAMFAVSAIIVGVGALIVGVHLSPVTQVIMHFDSAQQPDFTGSRQDVFMMIATGGVLVLINFLLARFFSQREHFTAIVIANTTVAMSILLFIATSVIIANNK
jgi:hypothetical protein